MSERGSKIMSKNTVDLGYDQSYDQNGLTEAGTCIQYRRVQREQLVWIPGEKAEENSFSGTFPGVYKIEFCLARRDQRLHNTQDAQAKEAPFSRVLMQMKMATQNDCSKSDLDLGSNGS